METDKPMPDHPPPGLFDNRPRLMTKPELAVYLGVSIATVGKLMDDGMPSIVVRGQIRFDPDEVLEWLKRGS